MPDQKAHEVLRKHNISLDEIPMFLPDYQPVGRDDMRGAFEKLWGQELDPERGLTVVEILMILRPDPADRRTVTADELAGHF